MSQAFDFLKGMFTHFSYVGPIGFFVKPLVLASCLLLVEWLQRKKAHALQFSANGIFRYGVVRFLAYITFLILIVLNTGEVHTFIYFQF